MGALDPAKILMILVVALVVLGPERLPRVARQLGSAWRELTRFREQVTEEVRAAIPLEDLPRIPRPSPGSITGFVAGLTATDSRPVEAVEHIDGSATDAVAATDADASATQGPPVLAEPGAGSTRRTAPLAVMHPSLGEFALLPDDPSMN
jgi:Sec-independent protein translocase protein TatA